MVSAYLKLEVPANGAASYKAYPGLYAIRSMRLLSGGQEVYTCNVQDFLVDYIESLSDEARKLKATGDVSKQQRQRLNRLVLEAALPDDVRPSPRDVVTPTYLGYVLFDDFSLDDKELDTSVKGVLQAFIFFFVSLP
mgnify:CR=1 FL=1